MMPSFFTTSSPSKKYSSAAAAQLSEEPGNLPENRYCHRRLASEGWLDDDEINSLNDNDDTNATTTSYSEYSSSSDSDDDDDDDHSDNNNDALSAISDSDMISLGEYDDGDLRTLNSLVNKLHAADIKRKRDNDRNRRIKETEEDGVGGQIIDDDIPSQLPPNPPPHFSPLQTSHRLSISAVESWRGESIEVIPTDSVKEILPKWNQEWKSDRLEYEERRKKSIKKLQELQLKRSRTLNDGRVDLSTTIGLQTRHHSLPGLRRQQHKKDDNSSATAANNRAMSMSAHATNRHYKYGKPPQLPNSNQPNPLVVSSSKKIHKKHARYALTAGMMLGIRESVGGALSVEEALQISNWEGWEQAWGQEDGVGEEEVQINETKLASTDDKDAPEQPKLFDQQQDNANDNSSLSSPTRLTLSQSLQRANEMQDAYTTLTAECERVTKYKFPPHQFYLGSNTSKPLPHKYKFKVYAPLVFARIRSLFGVEKQTFLHSICGKFNFYEFASNARSGQFFFYSHDGRYMIKTLTYTESKFLREILPHYYRHLTRYPSTFLTHFYGMYRVCMPNANNERLHFIIMRSVFHTEKKIDRVWDLKGSKTGRSADVGDSVSKDLDILEEGKKLHFKEPKVRSAFLEQLARDATFMARLGIMDYSLLLGVHDCESNEEQDHQVEATKKREDKMTNDTAGAESMTEDAPSTPCNKQQQSTTTGQQNEQQPSRSNTPFRRRIIRRAKSAGDTKMGNNGFKALEFGTTTTNDTANSGGGGDLTPNTSNKPATATRSTSLNAIPESPLPPPLKREPSVPTNCITSRDDSGIEGYGIKFEDGTLAKREIYFCGVIDILQYYNARKMGETVMRKSMGNSGQDISCVDPESYGKRFVKFISSLVEA